MSPRLPLILLGLAVVAPLATAQFGLDLSKVTKAIQTGKDVGKDVQDAGKVVKGAAIGIGPKEERQIGEAVSVEIIGRFGGLVRDKEIMRRINLVGRALARYSSRPNLDWQFAVLDSDTVNAFSAPGGLVFITRGLYQQATTDDLLAAVLAHEIAHIVNRNALKIVQRGDAASGGKNLLMKYSGDAREANAAVDQVNQVGTELGFDIVGAAKKIAVNGFDAPTEFSADKDGRSLAILTGYAPGGLRAVLTQLKANGENRKTMFATHPPLADRIKKLPNDPAPVVAAAEPAPATDAKDQPAGQTK